MSEPYVESDAEARVWHRRYDEQHRTLHAVEDEIERLRVSVAACDEIGRLARRYQRALVDIADWQAEGGPTWREIAKDALK